MKHTHQKLPQFNPLPKIIEIAKDREVPRQLIINDLDALIEQLREEKASLERYGFTDRDDYILIKKLLGDS